MEERNAIFISHASPEDNDFTLWLGSKLSAMGYEVWADVLRLKGGDDWQRKLEDALRNKSLKVLLVANSISVDKQGVRNEIQIATDVAKKIDDKEFIIPLRLAAYDAPFLVAHTQYIDFEKSWSDGFAELLETLDGHSVPKPATVSDLVDLESWRKSHLHKAKLIERKDEKLISNWLPVKSLPETIRYFDFKTGVVLGEKNAALRECAIPLVPFKRGFIGFASQENYQKEFGDSFPLKLMGEIPVSKFMDSGWWDYEIRTGEANRNISDLLRQGLERYLSQQDLETTQMANGRLAWWYPVNDENEGQISFAWENGPSGRRQILGYLKKSNFYWHYGLSFTAQTSPLPHIKLTSRVIFSQDGKTGLNKPELMFRLRRSKTKSWRNPRWRDMMLSFLSHLSKQADKIEISLGSDEKMVLGLPPLIFDAPVTVNEGDIDEEDVLESEEDIDTSDWDEEELDEVIEYEGAA